MPQSSPLFHNEFPTPNTAHLSIYYSNHTLRQKWCHHTHRKIIYANHNHFFYQQAISMRFLQPVGYLHSNGNGNNGNSQHIISTSTTTDAVTAVTDGQQAAILTNNATLNGINDINNSGTLNGNQHDVAPSNRLTSHEYINNYDNNDDHSNVTISDNVSFANKQNTQNLTRYQNSQYFHNNINQLNRTLINDNERSFYRNITSSEQVPTNVESLIQVSM